MLCFCGTRTYHRMVCGLEDAGFEIRETFMWLYGQGWPKGINISKVIDKKLGKKRKVVGTKFGLPGYREGPTGKNSVYGKGVANGSASCEITAPASKEAKQWDGWNTAIKPACEFIVLCRKPLSVRILIL